MAPRRKLRIFCELWCDKKASPEDIKLCATTNHQRILAVNERDCVWSGVDRYLLMKTHFLVKLICFLTMETFGGREKQLEAIKTIEEKDESPSRRGRSRNLQRKSSLSRCFSKIKERGSSVDLLRVSECATDVNLGDQSRRKIVTLAIYRRAILDF